MKNTKKALVVALSCVLVLCVALTFVVVPTSNAESGYTANWGTHELVQQADYNLRDGATESQFISYGPSAGSNVWYSRSVANYYDLSKVTVLTSYRGYDTLLKQGTYSTSTVQAQVDFVTSEYGWDVLGGINGTSFDTSNGAPNMGLMIDGVEYSDRNYPHGFFGIMYDSEGNQKAVIGKPDEVRTFFDHQRGQTLIRTEGGVEVDYTDFQMKHAIGGWSATIIYDGVLCDPSTWNEEHPRTAIGIKADGTVVTYVCEGRNQGRSGGMNLYTMATIMKDLGCVYAINLDGGGSSTALSRHEGETTYSNRIEGAYGTDRSVGDAILFVSTESYADRDPETTPEHDHTFARAQILPNQDLFISGTTVNFTATGSDAYGDPVALPEGLTWKLDEAQSTAGIGSIDPQTGVFTATHGATGNAVVNLCQGETVVGSTKVSFAWPDWTYSNNWTREFSIGLNEEQLMYFVLYPSNNELNKSFGISTWRPFVIQECDFTWNLPSDCSVEIRNNFCYFKAGSSVVADFTVSIAKINGTGQTAGAFTNLKALVNVGKAPKMSYDFEDGDWLLDIGGGGYSTNVYRATAEEGGKVLFGEASMAIDYDFSNANYIKGIDPSKPNNPTITWYNDNRGYNPVIPADASYFGFWMWVPEGMDGCWLRATLQGSNGGTNRTIMTDFVEMPKNPKVDQGTVSGNWRFYYGRLGVDISTNGAWTIPGPYSIWSVQLMWSAFGDTMLGYEYGQPDSDEAKEAARAEIEAKFNKASKGTIYVDNVMAMYGEPTSDMFAPYVSEMNVANTESGNSVTFKLSDENRYDTSTLAAIKYGEVQTLGDLLTVSGVNYSTLELYLNGSRIPAEQISVNEETGIVTVNGLSTIGHNDSLRIVAYDNFYNKLDKTITLRKITFTSGVATESDVAEIEEYLVWEGADIVDIEHPVPKTVDHDGYYFVEWMGEIPSVMPDFDVVITAVYSNLYKLTITEEGATEPLFSESIAYGTEIRLPERTGYTASWVTEGVPSTMPAAETNLVVKFTINNYQLAFKVDGEAYGEPQSVEYGSPITLPSSNREGYSITWQNAVGTMPANDLTIEGAFTINQYKVTYKQGEQVVAEKTQDYNSDIELPTITGYDVAWENAETRPTKVPADDVEVEVVLTAREYQLIFTVDGVTHGAPQTVAYGTTIALPTVDNRTGYTFAWASHPETMPAENLTIAGTYTVKTYTLTFTVDGVTHGEPQTVAYGTTITLPEVAAKEGYSFAWASHPETMPAENLTIAGTYTVKTYTLTFTVDGVTHGAPQTVAYGTTITLPEVAAKEGYSFAWASHPETMPANDLTIEGAFTINQYKVTFKQGEQVVAEKTQDYNSDIELPTITGYDVAWENAETRPTKVPADDVEVEVVLTAREYQLIFTVDGVTHGEPQTVAYGTTITLPEVAAKEGYSFAWASHPETMPANDLTIEGAFTINQYKVTFKQGEQVVAEVTQDYNSDIELPTITGYNVTWKEEEHITKVPARDEVVQVNFVICRYTLTFKVDGAIVGETVTLDYQSSIVYPHLVKTGYTLVWENSLQKMPAENVVINGTFVQNTYKLTFVIDGVVLSVSNHVYGDTIEYPSIAEKEGYSFAWELDLNTMPAANTVIRGTHSVLFFDLTITEADGETVLFSDKVAYGTEIRLPERTGHTASWVTEGVPATMPAENTDLVVKFTANKYLLTFIVDGEIFGTAIEVDFDKNFSLPEVPAKEGYTFAWTTENIPETMPAENLTIAGAYTINQYKVTFKQGEQVIAEKTQDYNSDIVLPSITGHSVIWKDAEHPAKVPARDVVIEVVLVANQHVLVIKEENIVLVATSASYGSAIEIPQREGYEFVWVSPSEPVTTMPDNDLTIVGFYKYAMYKVTFVQGEDENKQVVAEKEFLYGTAISLPTITGYDVAWKDANQVPEAMPSQDIELEVVLTAKTYTLTFTVDGEPYGEPQTVAYGAIITFPTVDDRTGHTFAWINPVDTMPANDLTIEGAYTAKTYTLTFTVDGKPYGEPQTVAYGAAITLPAVDNKLGYVFAWASHSETMTDGNLEISGFYSVDVDYVTEKVSAVANATSVEERFAAIKAANAAIAIYTEADKAEISDIIVQLENLKTQYTETASKANADLTVANKVLSALMSALVELTLAAAVAVIIKRRLF